MFLFDTFVDNLFVFISCFSFFGFYSRYYETCWCFDFFVGLFLVSFCVFSFFGLNFKYHNNYWNFGFCFYLFKVLFCHINNKLFIEMFNYRQLIYFFSVIIVLLLVFCFLLYNLNFDFLMNSIIIQMIFLDCVYLNNYLNEILETTTIKYNSILLYYFSVIIVVLLVLCFLLYNLNFNFLINSIIIQMIFLDYVYLDNYLNEILKTTTRKYNLILLYCYIFLLFLKNQNLINNISIKIYVLIQPLKIIYKHYKLNKYILVRHDIITTINYKCSACLNFRFLSNLLIFEKTIQKCKYLISSIYCLFIKIEIVKFVKDPRVLVS